MTLRLALEIGRLGSWERDLVTNEMSANAACKAHLGLASDEPLTFELLQKLQHPGDVERISQAITYALATKSDFNVEHRVVRPDGFIGRILVRGAPVFEDGRPVRLVGVTQDITERERAKEEIKDARRRQDYLLKLNEQLRSFKDPFAIMEATARSIGQLLKVDGAGFGEVDESRSVVLVEREWSRGAISNEGRAYRLQEFLYGMTDSSSEKRALAIADVGTDPRTGDPALQSFYSTINARAFLTVPLLKDGRVTAVFYVTSSTPRIWSEDELSLVVDVAERTWTAVEKTSAERSLHEAVSRFELFTEALPGFAYTLTPNLELLYTNEQKWFEYSGMTREQTLGYGWLSTIHPEDLEKVQEEAKRNTRGPLGGEVRYLAADGTYRWFLSRVFSVYNPEGELTGWVGTSVDIHSLKETEAALRKSEDRLALAQRAARIGVFDWDVSSGVITWTPEQEILFEILPNSFEGNYEGWASRVHPADVAVFEKNFHEAIARNDRELAFTYRIPLADGTFRNIEGTLVIFYGPDGSSPSRIVGVNIDVTKHKQAEKRQQLLIRELHHRVKNTLATVQAIVGSTARTANSIDEFYQGFVGRIVSLARTHNLLTEDLWQKAALEELIQTELGPYEDEARNRIVVEGPHVDLPSEAAVPIGMAIHELTTNAAKHGALSTFGGQVEVKWQIEPDEQRPMLHFSWTENGGPRVTAPSRQGFGSRLLQRVLATQLQAQVNMDFQEDGLRFTMVMPIPGEPPLFNPDK